MQLVSIERHWGCPAALFFPICCSAFSQLKESPASIENRLKASYSGCEARSGNADAGDKLAEPVTSHRAKVAAKVQQVFISIWTSLKCIKPPETAFIGCPSGFEPRYADREAPLIGGQCGKKQEAGRFARLSIAGSGSTAVKYKRTRSTLP